MIATLRGICVCPHARQLLDRACPHTAWRRILTLATDADNIDTQALRRTDVRTTGCRTGDVGRLQ